jgi:molybdenum cofactor cytidylyltransferase
MGSPKLLLPWEGDTVLGRTLANAKAGGLHPLIVICGSEPGAVAVEAKAKDVPCIINQDHSQGQSTSLKCGLKAALSGYGVMFVLGDMPAVLPQSYAALAAAYAKSRSLIVVPANMQGQHGNPTVWAPQLFPEIAQLSGDTGARGLMKKYREQMLLLPLEDQGLYMDIDTPEEYFSYFGGAYAGFD